MVVHGTTDRGQQAPHKNDLCPLRSTEFIPSIRTTDEFLLRILGVMAFQPFANSAGPGRAG